MKTKFHRFLKQFSIAVVINLFFTLLYFLIFFLSNWWMETLASFLVLVCLIFLPFIHLKKLIAKNLLLLTPSIILILFGIFNGENYYFGSLLEYRIRKYEFENDIQLSLQRGISVSVHRWPAWNSNAITGRYFLYSEKDVSQELQEERVNCNKTQTIKLIDNYYFILYLNCGGALG